MDRRIRQSGLSAASAALTPSGTDSLPAGSLKKLSLEELMDVEVTSVSRHPERLSGTASAIQVITGEDIRRSGATTLPEALRLAPNLQVAQANSSQWAISARGFDNVLADKLLVLIDGRTVYTPQYAGVYWDVQVPPLETIDRIEVISGPGGTLWGANAVNGVINIITKSAKDTQGWSVEAGGGQGLRGAGEIRYGGTLSPNVTYRAYASGFAQGNTMLTNGKDAHDQWNMEQGGFRMDWDARGADRVTVQSDYTNGRPDPDGAIPSVFTEGGNLLSRWTHTISDRSDFQLQAYYDRQYRNLNNGVSDDLETYDIDWQHRFPLTTSQEVTWGLGARFMNDRAQNLPLFAFLPSRRMLHLYSAFLQDEVDLVPNHLRLTIGSKFENNDYTGFEVQPSIRLALTPTDGQTIWTAVSRAVRTPARLDRDFNLFITPTIPLIKGADFQSETVVAYEAGWRSQVAKTLSFSLSTFYNVYDDLRTAAPGTGPANTPITFANGVGGHSDGAELSVEWQVNDRWRLRGGHTYFTKHLFVKAGNVDLNNASSESDDPANQSLVQSSLDLPGGFEWDAVARYVDALPNPAVSRYFGLDLRFGWHVMPRLELSVTGQNLLDYGRVQFIPSSPSTRQIPRTIYAQVTWR